LVGGKTAHRYAYLEELAESAADQISIEAAQPSLDLTTLQPLVDAGKTIVLGTLDLGTADVEPAQTVLQRIRPALHGIPAKQLMVARDCGMKYLARDVAEAKLKAMVAAAETIRQEA